MLEKQLFEFILLNGNRVVVDFMKIESVKEEDKNVIVKMESGDEFISREKYIEVIHRFKQM